MKNRNKNEKLENEFEKYETFIFRPKTILS